MKQSSIFLMSKKCFFFANFVIVLEKLVIEIVIKVKKEKVEKLTPIDCGLFTFCNEEKE